MDKNEGLELHWNLNETSLFEGQTIRYGVTGTGPAVVLVHGTPWSSYNLRHLCAALAEDHTVYYYDLLGYGQSDKPAGDVSLGIQNQVLAHLLDEWGLSSPMILGHDFGGSTVLRTHLLNHHPFEKIVLIDPVAVSPWGSPFFKHVNKHEAAFSGVPDYIHDAIVRAYVETAAYRSLDQLTADCITAPWTGEAGKAAFYRQIAQADSAYTDDVQSLYNSISVPVLILWGQEDTWIPVEKGEALHQMIPGSVFRTIPEAGHLVIEERPDQLLEFIAPFLGNQKIPLE